MDPTTDGIAEHLPRLRRYARAVAASPCMCVPRAAAIPRFVSFRIGACRSFIGSTVLSPMP